jgi:hypothetical protein
MRYGWVVIAFALAAGPAWAQETRTDVDCSKLARLALPHATITRAEPRRDGVSMKRPAATASLSTMPACRPSAG